MRHSGAAEGGVAATIRFAEEPVEFRDEIVWRSFADRALAGSGVLAAELWSADRVRSAIPSRETSRRGGSDASTNGAIVLHATDVDAAGAALNAVNPVGERLAAWQGAPVGIYRLQFAVSRA